MTGGCGRGLCACHDGTSSCIVCCHLMDYVMINIRILIQEGSMIKPGRIPPERSARALTVAEHPGAWQGMPAEPRTGASEERLPTIFSWEPFISSCLCSYVED